MAWLADLVDCVVGIECVGWFRGECLLLQLIIFCAADEIDAGGLSIRPGG